MKRKMTVLANSCEIINYNMPGTDFALQYNKLSYFDNMRAMCHWHEEIEMIRILTGEMLFYVNGHEYLLREGQGLIVNSKQLHYGCARDNHDCDFYCIVVHPNVYNSQSDIYKNFVEKIIHNDTIEALLLEESNIIESKIIKEIDTLMQTYKQGPICKEMVCNGILYNIWFYCYQILSKRYDLSTKIKDNNLILQRQMTNFIYQNYNETISLADIAASGNICRNKCCQLFKRYVQQSPINFLNAYRLKKSLELLRDSDLSITEIATACGFNHLSYFEKLFFRHYKQTPRHYRQAKLK